MEILVQRAPLGPAGADGANNERTTISLSLLGAAQNPAAEFNESAAEIVTFDPTQPEHVCG